MNLTPCFPPPQWSTTPSPPTPRPPAPSHASTSSRSSPRLRWARSSAGTTGRTPGAPPPLPFPPMLRSRTSTPTTSSPSASPWRPAPRGRPSSRGCRRAGLRCRSRGPPPSHPSLSPPHVQTAHLTMLKRIVVRVLPLWQGLDEVAPLAEQIDVKQARPQGVEAPEAALGPHPLPRSVCRVRLLLRAQASTPRQPRGVSLRRRSASWRSASRRRPRGPLRARPSLTRRGR